MTETPTATEAERMVGAEAVAKHFDISEQTVWREVREGRFPPPVYVTSKAPRWRLSEVVAHVEANRRTPVQQQEARRAAVADSRVQRQRAAKAAEAQSGG